MQVPLMAVVPSAAAALDGTREHGAVVSAGLDFLANLAETAENQVALR